MSIQNPVETLIGAGVLGVAIFFAVYTAQSTGGATPAGSYELTASFRSANGVSPGTDVRIAGVKVGSVSTVELNRDTFDAEVTMLLNDDVELADDTLAKIDSESLLGGSYIALDPGVSPDLLEPGDAIDLTQGSLSILDLINKFTSSGGDSGSSGDGA